jgi:hypothetical protein
MDRYLYPIFGLLWLFFAINFGKIKNVRCFALICALLIMISIISYTTTFKKEYQEGNNYNKLHAFIKENIRKTDMIIFEPNINVHTYGIFSYLLYDNMKIVSWERHFDKVSLASKEHSYNEYVHWIFNAQCISYTSFLKTNTILDPVWIVVGNWGGNVKIPTDENTQLCGEFSWMYYQFDIYRTKTPKTIVESFKKQL